MRSLDRRGSDRRCRWLVGCRSARRLRENGESVFWVRFGKGCFCSPERRRAGNRSSLVVENFGRQAGVGGDVADEFEDGSVEEMELAADSLRSDGLGEVGFSYSWRGDEEVVALLQYELAGAEFTDAGAGLPTGACRSVITLYSQVTYIHILNK